MYSVKGFMVLQPLCDNRPSVLSPIGELSTYALTYSQDTAQYSHTEAPDADLMVFHSQRDDEPQSKLDNTYIEPLLRIGQWLYTTSVGGIFSNDEEAFATAFLAEFADTVTNLTVGSMVQDTRAEFEGSSVFLPEYIRFSLINVDGGENEIRIWLADQAFRAQYDEYTIKIVPPFDNVDDFFLSAQEVKARLDQYDDAERMERLQVAIDRKPPSLIKVELYEWANPLQPEYELSTPWGIVIYGIAGNNVDTIKSTLVEYILERSSHVRTEWEDYLPDLFKATEFIITPLWDNFSIPNETLVKGLYSPTIRHKEVLAKAQATATRYEPAHVEDVLVTSVSNYRSMGFLAVGGADNRDGITVFYDRFPDYVVIPTSSSEFGRMSKTTQDFVVLLSKMLKVADEMSEFSDLPIGMSRLVRDEIMYLVASFEAIQYLVVARVSYNSLFVTEPVRETEAPATEPTDVEEPPTEPEPLPEDTTTPT